MTVPSIVNLVPARGPTSGALVQVFGDGFRLPTIPDTTPAVAPPPSVEVLFDGVPGTDVKVLRTNRVLVQAPRSPVPPRVIRMTGTPDLTFVAATKTITRDVGDWLADGFRPEQRIFVQGTVSNETPRNAGGQPVPFRVVTVTALVLTLAAAETLTDEGPVSGTQVATRAYGEGIVDITVRNLDDNGDPIGGETVTVTAAYAYERVQLATETDFTRLVRELIRQVRLQVITNASTTTHVDFDSDVGDLLDKADLAGLPGIALIGPDTTENRFYSLNGPQVFPQPNGEVHIRREPHTVDLEFTVVGISDLKFELMNLHAQWNKFVDHNPFIFLDRDPSDPSAGQVKYEMEFIEGVTTGTRPNASNLRTFAGALVIRGFDHEDQAGFVDEQLLDVTTETVDVPDSGVGTPAAVAVGVSQTGSSFDVGPSPGGC